MAAYWQATSTDWTKVPAQDLLAMKLKEEYSQFGNATPERVARAVQMELRDTYGFGVNDDPESEEVFKAQFRAERDAQAYRQSKITQQQDILTSLALPAQQQAQAIEADTVQAMAQNSPQIRADHKY